MRAGRNELVVVANLLQSLRRRSKALLEYFSEKAGEFFGELCRCLAHKETEKQFPLLLKKYEKYYNCDFILFVNYQTE